MVKMNSDSIPVKVSGVIDTEMGDDMVLFHPKHMSYYGLNVSAALVWKLVDGKTSAPKIIDDLVNGDPDSEIQIRQEVPGVLSELEKLGFLEFH
jgi:hypothetical protein